jgi:glucose-1-phosphate thymidylyltransferase
MGDPRATDDLIAVIPAAGFATRLEPLPCSKEILPVGDKPLIGFLLERLARGGVRRAIFVTRRQKRDIADLLGDGGRFGLELDYVLIEPTSSTVATLDRAYERTRDHRVALGFPDVVFRPADAYRRLIDTQRGTGADVVLGLFPSTEPEKSDMVELDAEGGIVRLVIKQPDRGLRYTWSIAVWSPAFTEYLHRCARRDHDPEAEIYVGDVIQAAIRDGLTVRAEVFPDGANIDLGTRDTLTAPPDWIA